MLHSLYSPFYNVKIVFLSYDYSLSGSISRKIDFVMLYVYKMDTTHAGIASSYDVLRAELVSRS